MDAETLAAYDGDPVAFATDWHEQPAPSDLHAVVRKFFTQGPTADIGCGSGRDTAWLARNGYPAIGYDASRGLLAEARRRYPELSFREGTLPELAGVAAGSFTNVLCETVIMHLDPALVGPSVTRMMALLEPGGALYLTWRVTAGSDRRDELGRLYAAFDTELVTDALSSAKILLDEEKTSVSSNKTIHRIVAKKV
jgi:2-polyprenyl-3-methyl-5-hydroxy-6-metoxy-1,4-benzoquinol methylase